MSVYVWKGGRAGGSGDRTALSETVELESRDYRYPIVRLVERHFKNAIQLSENKERNDVQLAQGSCRHAR